MQRQKSNFDKACEISKILDCLSNPNRLLITCMLIEGEKKPSEILDEIGTTKGNISQHLKLLELSGIIKAKRDGNKIYYSINDEKVKKLVTQIKKIYCAEIRFSK